MSNEHGAALTNAGRIGWRWPAASLLSDPRRANQIVLLMLVGTAVCTGLLSVITVDRLKDAAVAVVLHGGRLSPAMLLAALRWQDFGFAVLAAGSVGCLAVAEWRARAVSCFLETATAAQAFAALTIIAAWTGQAYLSAGVLLGGDTGTYIARFLEVARGLSNGELATWTNYQYLGEPLLWFTGPLTYIVGGVLAWITGDAVVAAKVLLFTCHVGVAWLMFALLRRMDFRPIPALVAAAGFAGCFACLHLFLYRGVFPQALTIVFLVLLFFAAEGLMRTRGQRWLNVTLFAFATAGLILNHQPHGIYAAFYLGLFAGVCLLSGRWNWNALPALVIAGLCGVLMSTVAVLPLVVESRWVMIEPGSMMFGLRLPTVKRLVDLVVWRDTRTTWGIDYWAYLGITLLSLGAIGAVASLRGVLGRDRRFLAIAACVCIGVDLFVYNPEVRDVLFLAFFLALLVGTGMEWLETRHRRAVLLAVVLVLADIGSTSIQPVARTDKEFAVDAGKAIERLAPQRRFLEFHVGDGSAPEIDVGPDSGPMSFSATVQRVAGNHNMAATWVHNYAIAAAKMAETDLRRDGTLLPVTRSLLGMLNVGRIICLSPIAVGCPGGIAANAIEPGLGRDITLAAVPAMFSRRLVAMPPPAGMDKPMLWPGDFYNAPKAPVIRAIDRFLTNVAAAEATNPGTAQANALAVRALPAGYAATESAGAWSPRVTAYAVSLDRITMRITSDKAGFAQLSHPWFPATDVTVNGLAIKPLQGATDLMVIPIHAGDTAIEIVPGTTPIRQASGWLSLLGVLVTLLAAAGLAALDRRPARIRLPGSADPEPTTP